MNQKKAQFNKFDRVGIRIYKIGLCSILLYLNKIYLQTATQFVSR